MAEGQESNKPPVINVTVNYKEGGTTFAGDNVRQKTNVQATGIDQVILPTTSSTTENSRPSTLECDSTPARVLAESEEAKVERFNQDSKPTLPSLFAGTAKSIPGLSFSEGMKEFIAIENSRHFIQNSKFVEALDLIEDLPSSPWQQLMMSECYFQLGRERNALRCVEALQTMVTSPPRPDVDDVIKLVDNCIDNASYIRALVLLSCCAKLYKFESNPNISITGLKDCSFKCGIVIESLAEERRRMKILAKDVGLEMITDMLKDLRSVSGADKNKKTDMEARCLNNVGLSCYEVGEYKKAIGYYEEGVDLMEQTFSSNALKYKVFGDLLNNIGNAHHNLGNFYKAESFYLKSLEAKENAKDCSCNKVKQESIELTKNNLKITQNQMKM
ncbi:uncharacterized protein LOC120343034 [Styela clava]